MSQTARRARLLNSAIITAQVADLTDATQFPEIAKARAHYAALSDERKAELEREWVR